jgi:hypothetical protein
MISFDGKARQPIKSVTGYFADVPVDKDAFQSIVSYKGFGPDGYYRATAQSIWNT